MNEAIIGPRSERPVPAPDLAAVVAFGGLAKPAIPLGRCG